MNRLDQKYRVDSLPPTSIMASTSKLTLFTKSPPVPYGPLGLAGYIHQQAGQEGVITTEYAEKSTGTDDKETCRLESAG